MGLKKYLLKNLADKIITIWFALTILFLVYRILPGDPAMALLDPTWPPEVYEEKLHSLGLDRPLYEQYFLFFTNLLRGELGNSFTYRVPVLEVIANKLLNTVILTTSTFFATYLLAIPLGIIFAWKYGSKIEQLGSSVFLALRSTPSFWLGTLLVFVFSLILGWLPTGRIVSPELEKLGLMKYFTVDFFSHLILPTATSVVYNIALPLLLLRDTMLELRDEDFVDLARAKGLGELTVMYKHVARNAILPLLTSAAIFIGVSMGGQIMIEYVFSWPGLGQELVIATQRRDYPIAQGILLIYVFIVILANFIADLLYGYFDPRISHE